MSLLGGDLTTPLRVGTWLSTPPQYPSIILNQLIGSMSGLIYSKLNRARTYNQTFTRVFDGVGNMQLVLPDYPVTSILSVYEGSRNIPQSVVVPSGSVQSAGTTQGYGYRYIPWGGDLPGQNTVLEFKGGYFYSSPQNVKVTYNAGYLISNESQVVPSPAPYIITVNQPQGIWCRDNGVTYANGVSLTPVKTITSVGQYIPPPDVTPGLYTFSSADSNKSLLISYSFIPADLEEACIQMVAERYMYRSRIGEMSKSLGGQETVSFMRRGLPPEVESLIQPYVSVVYPNIGAPL